MSEQTPFPQVQQNNAAPTPLYAGFWIRAWAFLVDCLILMIPLGLVTIALVGFAIYKTAPLLQQMDQQSENIPPEAMQTFLIIYGGILLMQLLGIVLFWLYFALQESGTHQATWGKRLFGLRVTDANGARLSFAHATGRTFAKYISYMTLYIGYMMAGWTQKKQALHDLIANTFVVKNH